MSFAWLKPYFPRGLYGRAALILLLPVVFLQLVVSVLFTQRHFEDVTQQMSDTVARELRLVLHTAEMSEDLTTIAADLERRAGALEISVGPASLTALEEPDRRRWYDFSGLVIAERLRSYFPGLAVVDLGQDRIVRLDCHVRVERAAGDPV